MTKFIERQEMETRKAAVIGYPVKHSLSPVIHGYWINQHKKELEEKGVNAEYGLLEVKPEDLYYFLSKEIFSYVGCNFTVPHKEVVYQYVAMLDNEEGKVLRAASIIGAVNTLSINERYMVGANTDAYGFIENIKQSKSSFDFTRGKAVVLGAGGAARAVVISLLKEGVPEVIIVNRTPDKAVNLARDSVESVKKGEKISVEHGIPEYQIEFFDRCAEIESDIGIVNNNNVSYSEWNDRNEILADANLLVNTTSLGMKGMPELDINLEKLPKNALVTDIVYSPIEVDKDNPTFTKLLKNASKRGNLVVEGLGMLLYQAVAGFEMWFGIKPVVTEDLRKHVLSHLK
jgi:shikimate dehydrogenase